MSNEFRGGDAYRIRYERRDMRGDVMSSGETGGAKAWLDNPRFGSHNAIKRVKTALGMLWSVKTTRTAGDGDICRALEDGSTLHIWIDRPNGAAPRQPAPRHVDNIIRETADRVARGEIDIQDDTALAAILRDAIEYEIFMRENYA